MAIPARAQSVRKAISAILGDDLAKVRPGSPEAARVKEVLLAQNAWSQYLEVGIGPDAEIFTKAQPMSSVGTGAAVGIHPKSAWNNPEPEVVLFVDSRGTVQGAALGNDVNLRDFEGRSALLLGKAKDNNASCAIGPLLRLFDDRFGIDDVRALEIRLRVEGEDGFALDGSSSMAKISRDPLDLVAQAIGPHHQYPDGFVLFCGTMFAPVQDRHGPGQGFTHAIGDVVTIATPAARRAGQPRRAHGRDRAVDLRDRGADAQPRAARPRCRTRGPGRLRGSGGSRRRTSTRVGAGGASPAGARARSYDARARRRVESRSPPWCACAWGPPVPARRQRTMHDRASCRRSARARPARRRAHAPLPRTTRTTSPPGARSR